MACFHLKINQVLFASVIFWGVLHKFEISHGPLTVLSE